MTPTTFLLLALATWRLSSLLANEPGPFLVFRRIRRKARELCRTNRLCRKFHLYDGLTCEWCNSVWIGTALTIALGPFLALSVPQFLTLPLALSTCTIVVKYTVHTLERIAK